MGPELALIVAGMFAKYMANKGATDRQNSLQQAMQAYQTSRAKENEAAINQLADQQTPTARKTEMQNIDASRQASMQNTVDAARLASPVNVAAGANASSDYKNASAASTDTVANRTKRAIQQLGMMGAPGEAGISSGIRFGRAAGAVDAGNNAIGNVGAGYMRDINNVVPDPMMSTLGDVAIGFGSGGVGGVGGAALGMGASGATAYRRQRMNNAWGQYGYGNGYNTGYVGDGGNSTYIENQ